MNELILVFLPLFRLGHLRCLSQSINLLWRRLLPCNIHLNPLLKLFAELFSKKRQFLLYKPKFEYHIIFYKNNRKTYVFRFSLSIKYRQAASDCREGCRFRFSGLVGVQRYDRDPKNEKLEPPGKTGGSYGFCEL